MGLLYANLIKLQDWSKSHLLYTFLGNYCYFCNKKFILRYGLEQTDLRQEARHGGIP